MTEQTQSDLLLKSARLLVILGQIVIMIASIGIAIGIGALLTVGRGEVYERIAQVGAPDVAYPLSILAFALIIVMLQIGYRFLKNLGGIIATVGEGDPFALQNAERLSRMGWLTVAGHVLAIILGSMAAWFMPYLVKLDGAKSHHTYDFGFEVGLGGILLTLILFILARVFRQGAKMREELEGTV
jgi:hypothetical protein